MMNLLQAISGAGGGGAIAQLAKNFGIGESQAQSAVAQLLPALSSGFKRNVSTQDGLNSLMSTLSGGTHQKYLEDPATLGAAETTRDGNGILGHLLGSKEVSRKVADRAAERTGLSSGILKKMLPVVAAMAMGSLSQQTSSAGLQRALGSGGAQSSGILGMLTPMLDADGDGSVADDLLGFASKLF